jgi:hypothetical protein
MGKPEKNFPLKKSVSERGQRARAKAEKANESVVNS